MLVNRNDHYSVGTKWCARLLKVGGKHIPSEIGELINQTSIILQLENTNEKLQAILELFHENVQILCYSNGCEFATTDQDISCPVQDTNVVMLRAKLFTTPNMFEGILDSIEEWTAHTSSIRVQGLRLYFTTNCPITVESLDSPLLNCYSAATPRTRIVEALAIIAFVGCGILTVAVVLLMVYIAYRRYTAHNHKTQIRYYIVHLTNLLLV